MGINGRSERERGKERAADRGGKRSAAEGKIFKGSFALHPRRRLWLLDLFGSCFFFPPRSSLCYVRSDESDHKSHCHPGQDTVNTINSVLE